MDHVDHQRDSASKGAIDALHESVERAHLDGRQTLVVLGAGCSRELAIPLMTDIYRCLEQACRDHSALNSLVHDLETLGRVAGPRSLAARTLACLQQPTLLPTVAAQEAAASVWQSFALQFLMRKIPVDGVVDLEADKKTIFEVQATAFHRLVGRWIVDGSAVAVSLNFDGLTRRGVMDAAPDHCCSILSDPQHIERYFLADTDRQAHRPYAVIKVWGDVFHAVCRTDGCPEFDSPVPLYDLPASRYGKSASDQSVVNPSIGERSALSDEEQREAVLRMLQCPQCHRERQLQIYFPGYQKKEGKTRELTDALRRFVAPRIGNIIVAGVSGQWDTAVTDFLAELAHSIGANRSTERLFCVDPKDDTFIQAELRRRGLAVTHVKGFASELGKHTVRRRSTTPHTESPRTRLTPILATNQLWAPLLTDGQGHISYPVWYHNHFGNADGPIRTHLESLGQLGLKTAMRRPIKAEGSESAHTRATHSIGVAHLAWYWGRALLSNGGLAVAQRLFNGSKERDDAALRNLVQAITLLAGSLHDIGHLPFTHLTEEVFAELNWTTIDWAASFRHDERVLYLGRTELSQAARSAVAEAAGDLAIPCLERLVTRAIEGRSGVPFLDAILNSPIDADKIDYLFLDARTIEEDAQLPVDDAKRLKWVSDFVEAQRILPSGILAISGPGAVRARVLLEERRRMYKDLYFRPAYRVIERLARHVIATWLVRDVHKLVMAGRVASANCLPRINGDSNVMRFALRDSRAAKGQAAAQELWARLYPKDGAAFHGCREVYLIHELIRHLREELSPTIDECTSMWLDDTDRVLRATLQCLDADHATRRPYMALVELLRGQATWSERLYVSHNDFRRSLRDIIREIELIHPGAALIDAAAMPRMLSYPHARRFRSDADGPIGECWAVPHRDPDRWENSTGRWIPLSDTIYREVDKRRWVQIIVVSPRPSDHARVRGIEDLLRSRCDAENIHLHEEDPDAIGLSRVGVI